VYAAAASCWLLGSTRPCEWRTCTYEDWSDDGARDECVGHVDSLRPGTWLLLREHGHSPSPTTPLPTPPPLPEITVSDISSSSSYLPNNTTVCAFASIQFRRAGQQGPTRTLKRVIKQLLMGTFYHTNKVL